MNSAVETIPRVQLFVREVLICGSSLLVPTQLLLALKGSVRAGMGKLVIAN